MSDKKNGKKTRVSASRSQRLGRKRDQIRDWIPALVHQEHAERVVKVEGLCGDESLRPADSPILWTVDLEIAHEERAESVYVPRQDRKFADPTEDVRLTLTIGHARGRDVPQRKYEIECELGHLDNLAETLTAALMIGRRDGLLPVVRGMAPWQALVGEPVNSDPRGKRYLYGELKSKVDPKFKIPPILRRARA